MKHITIILLTLAMAFTLFAQDQTIPQKIVNLENRKAQAIQERDGLNQLILNINGAIWAYQNVLSDTVKVELGEAVDGEEAEEDAEEE